MSWNFGFIQSHQELNITKLSLGQIFPKIVMQCASWIAGKLESEHIAASYIVIHGAPKNVHGIIDHSRSVKNTTSWYFRFSLRNNDRPNLRVQVIAMKIIGQCVIGRATEDVQKSDKKWSV